MQMCFWLFYQHHHMKLIGIKGIRFRICHPLSFFDSLTSFSQLRWHLDTFIN